MSGVYGLHMCTECCVLIQRHDSHHPLQVIATMQSHVRKQIEWTIKALLSQNRWSIFVHHTKYAYSTPGTDRYVGLKAGSLWFCGCTDDKRTQFLSFTYILNLDACQNHIHAFQYFDITSFKFTRMFFFPCSSLDIPNTGRTCVCQIQCYWGLPIWSPCSKTNQVWDVFLALFSLKVHPGAHTMSLACLEVDKSKSYL